MEWVGKLVETVFGALPSAAKALCPPHIKRQWAERLADNNPFKTISANQDLLRAVRLAWLEATQEVLEQAGRDAQTQDSRAESDAIDRCNALVRDKLLAVRDHALDRGQDAGASPIDGHVQAIIYGVPELVAPGLHGELGDAVTTDFAPVLAALVGWPETELPGIYGQIAAAGLPMKGSGQPRAFGELVFACFAEILKDPTKYPQAGKAFQIVMAQMGRDIGQKTLVAASGLDPKLDQALAGLDGLAVMGRRIEAGVEDANRKLDDQSRKLDALTTDVASVMAALRQSGALRQAGEQGLAESTILALAQPLRPEEAHDLNTALAAVNHAVEIALATIRRGERPASNEDAFVDAVLAEVARRTRVGAFDSAAQAVDDGLAELATREAEQRDAMRRARATLLKAGIDQDILRRDAAAVARRVEALVALEVPERAPWAPSFRARWDAFFAEGRDKGLNLSLEIAVALARRMLAASATPDERGTAGNLRGNALLSLGERESGTERMEEAVLSYRAALEERTRDRVPLDWATTQSNLGCALWSLGGRECGTARLEEAVLAHRAALGERTRDRVPLDWAATQNNLGNALWSLGERESGTARLKEAVLAHRAALKERTRARVPFDWALTQNNLGIALRALGERESSTARLRKAVLAYRAALKERTRDRVPLDWAATQNNLGNALRALGERESGTARLKQAVLANRAALEEWTRDRVPLDWAMSQNYLGNALSALGKRESGTARLEEAVLAYRAALKERTRDRVPLDWAMSFGGEGAALSLLSDRRGDAALAGQALAQIEAALAVFRDAGHAPYAAYYEAAAAEARQLLERLRAGE
jgi:tetratricopeptide (TPR) repeat protein